MSGLVFPLGKWFKVATHPALRSEPGSLLLTVSCICDEVALLSLSEEALRIDLLTERSLLVSMIMFRNSKDLVSPQHFFYCHAQPLWTVNLP